MKSRFFSLQLWIALLVVGSLIFVAAAPTQPVIDLDDIFDGEHAAGQVYTMVDEDGAVIMRTARRISEGDEYISQNNNYYRVKSVDGTTAHAEFIETIVLAEPEPESFLARAEDLLRLALPTQQEGEGKTKKIGIYSSHGAEAYIKGDGAESQEEGGGILDVADSLQASLEKKGVEVLRSKNLHTPHDAGAYVRSRRTAEELLKQNPDALIDVHRDAVPEEEYLENVEGKERVQVQLVVGRQNQNIAANRKFAEGVKKQADEEHPGLVKGIFMARGNYNQDMTPTAMLIEVGSHTNDKAQAEETMTLFSEVVTDYLYGAAENGEAAAPAPTDTGRRTGTALRSVMWIVIGLVVAVAAFLLISTGGWTQMKQKLGNFRNKEMSNFLGAPSDKSKDQNKDKQDDGGPEGS